MIKYFKENIFIVLPVMFLIIAAIIFVVRFVFAKKRINANNVLGSKFRMLYLRIYAVLDKIPMLNNYMTNVKKRIFSLTSLGEIEIRCRAAKILLQATAILVVIFGFLFYIIDKTFYNILLISIVSLFLFNVFVKKRAGNDLYILQNLPDALDDLKHNHATYHTMSIAYDKTIKGGIPHSMGLHLKKIKDIIDCPANIARLKLKEYYADCPDKFLKLLASYSFIIKEVGDKKKAQEEDVNSFSYKNSEDSTEDFGDNITHLIKMIRNEYRKRTIIDQSLIGLSFVILLPLFALPAIKSFFIKIFPMAGINEFFNSSLGQIMYFICVFSTILLYLLYNSIKGDKDNHAQIKLFSKSWSDKLLKYSIFQRIVAFLMPKDKSSKYQDIQNVMNRAGKFERMESFYFKKLLFGIGAFVFMFIVIQASHIASIHNIYNNLYYGSSIQYIAQVDGFSKSEKDQLTIDKEVMNQAQKLSKTTGVAMKVAVSTALKSYFPNTNDVTFTQNVTRITDKLKTLNGVKFFSYDLLVVLVIAFSCYFLPNLSLRLSASGEKYSMYDEVVCYNTIILLLMNYERVNVRMIIDWMLWFSDIFYKPLSYIKNNLSAQGGGGKVILKVMEEVDYKPFRKLLHKLYLSNEESCIADAFAGLKEDHKYDMEQRKDNTEFLAQTKIAIASRIVTVNLGITIALYVVLPLVLAIFKMMNTYKNGIPS